jgi:hypothetical protein
MKNLFILTVFALTALTSCKKDYTCTCTATVFGVSASSSTIINDTKSKAKDKCDQGDVADANSTVNCEIK